MGAEPGIAVYCLESELLNLVQNLRREVGK